VRERETSCGRRAVSRDPSAQGARILSPIRDSSVSTWMYKVALFTATTWISRELRHREDHESIDAGDDASLARLGEAPSSDDRLEWLYQQLGRLEPVDRSIMLMDA